MNYEDSIEETKNVNASEMSERRWLLFEKIQALSSMMIQNLTHLCPLNNQHEYTNFVASVTKGTLDMIYENEETLASIQFYESIMPELLTTFENCVKAPSSKISLQEFFSHDYPEKILHLDLMQNSDDSSKWYDFRQCVRTREKSKFYPGLVPAMIDTLWNGFLMGYYACMDFWENNVDPWSYMDVAQSTILLPVYQRWKSKFPIAEDSLISSKLNTRKIKVGNTTFETLRPNVSSVTYMLKSLEKCNVISFMKYPSDPIPCFKDVIEDFLPD